MSKLIPKPRFLQLNCADVLHALAISARLVKNNISFTFKIEEGMKILVLVEDVERVKITLAGLPFEIKARK